MKYRMRFDENDAQKFHFIATIVGQSEIVFGKPVFVADIAPTLGVSKPTAQKFLDRMVELGYLVKRTIRYRSNAVKYEYRLTQAAYNRHQDGLFRAGYEWHKSLIFSIRAMPGSKVLSI